MHDVIPTIDRSDRLLLAVSLPLFAVAGLAHAAGGSTGQRTLATGVAVLGVYALALYARSVSRKTLATHSLALWVAFLAVAGAHAVGLSTVATVVPAPGEGVVHVVTALTWATLLGAGSATAFLGFREYGAGTRADTHDEQVLEQEYDL